MFCTEKKKKRGIHKQPTDPTDATVARVRKNCDTMNIFALFHFRKIMANKRNMTTSAIYEHLNEKNLWRNSNDEPREWEREKEREKEFNRKLYDFSHKT